MRKTNILITGGSGYIGSRLLQYMMKDPSNYICSISRGRAQSRYDGRRVSVVRTDLNNTKNYKDELLKAEYILWLAANRKHYSGYQKLCKDNVQPLERVLPILKHSVNLKRFVYISSISAMDNTLNSKGPISIENEPRPTTPYGLTKFMAEKLVSKSGIPFITLRLPFMYGSGFKSYSHLWLWRLLAHSSLLNRFQFPGRLSLLHINDFSEIVMSVIEGRARIAENTEHILCDGGRYRINDIIDCVGRIYGKDACRKKIEIGSFVHRASNILSLPSLKYWSKVLTDEWYFTAVSTEDPFLRNYRFMGLYEGLVETYS
jgi:nucleoside-diphosphate-sugar epimerase